MKKSYTRQQGTPTDAIESANHLAAGKIKNKITIALPEQQYFPHLSKRYRNACMTVELDWES